MFSASEISFGQLFTYIKFMFSATEISFGWLFTYIYTQNPKTTTLKFPETKLHIMQLCNYKCEKILSSTKNKHICYEVLSNGSHEQQPSDSSSPSSIILLYNQQKCIVIVTLDRQFPHLKGGNRQSLHGTFSCHMECKCIGTETYPPPPQTWCCM